MGNFPIEEISVLGDSYIKVTGAIGANSPVAYYVLPNPEQPSVLRIDAHTVEADADQDGIQEIVATVGTAAHTTIYKLRDKLWMVCDLNELLQAQVVLYDPETHLFQIQMSDHRLTGWKFQGSKLQTVQ